MLFDLRARGRRRTVKFVYGFLAVLIGIGLVGFGVGGSGFGLFNGNNNTSSTGGADLSKQVRQLERRARANPSNKHLWAEIAETHYEDAASDLDSTTGVYSTSGLTKLKAAATAWERYLSLKPSKPDTGIAGLMVQAYGALGRYAKATAAAEVVADAAPSSGSFQQLAQLAWAAGQDRKGDLAEQKAISLAPKDQRKTVKSNLDDAKTQIQQSQSGTQTTG